MAPEQSEPAAQVPEEVMTEAESLARRATQNQLSQDEIRLLDDMMRSQVNDMLEDILKDRRQTFGMWSEEEEQSDDSFDEKYLPRSSSSLTGKEEEEEVKEKEEKEKEEEEVKEKEEKEKEEEEEVKEKEELKEEKKQEEEKEEEKPKETEQPKSPFLHLEKCDDRMMFELMGADMPEEEEEQIVESLVNAVNEAKNATQEEEKPAEDVITEVDDGEEKKEQKVDSGFWCKGMMLSLTSREADTPRCCCSRCSCYREALPKVVVSILCFLFVGDAKAHSRRIRWIHGISLLQFSHGRFWNGGKPVHCVYFPFRVNDRCH